MNIAYIPLLIGILLNTCGQLLLKAGMAKIGYFSFSLRNLVPIGLQVLSSSYIIVGLICYVISVGAWCVGLSRVNVSVAYPMLSLGYIVVAIIAYFFMDESLSALRIGGILVILIGVFMITRP